MRRDFLRTAIFSSLIPLLPGGRVLAAPESEDRLAGDLRRAWELLEAGDQEATVKFVEHALSTFQEEARAQALTMPGFAVAGKELEFHKVNIAGTLLYIRAVAFQRAGKRAEWLAGLRRVWTEFPFSQAWDPKDWFWKPGQAAKKEGYTEILAGAVRDRILKESPFPAEEDALDYPQMSIALAAVTSQTLEKADYDGLEFLAGRLQSMKLRFPDGTPTLSVFFTATGGASGPEKEESAWDLAAKRLQDWHQAFPKSVFPRIADAHRLIRHAWHVRGSGYANEVKPEAWQVFNQRLRAAAAVLDDCPRTCPEWYEERLTAAMALSEPLKAQQAIFQEGWKAFPGYNPILTAMVTSLLPRWGGQPGDYMKFARRLEKTDGAKTFTLAVNEAWSYERASILEEKDFDPALYRKGWIELLDGHKGSLSLIHQCLVAALSLNDTELSREAFKRAGERYHPAFWTTPQDYLGAKKAALSGKE